MAEPTIDELRAKQQAHTESQDEERRVRAEEEAQRVEDERRAGEAVPERGNLLDELRAEQEKAGKMEEEGIAARIEDAQRIRDSRDEAQRQLEETTVELQAVQERLGGIKQIVDEARQGGYEVDPEVETALDNTQGQYDEVNQRFQGLSTRIQELEASLISDELIQQYQDAKRRVGELSQRIFEIESNPAVIRILEREAKSEDELRSIVSETLVAVPEYRPVPPVARAEYLRQLAQIYAGEAFAYKGIRDPGGGDREAAEKLIQDVVKGLSTHNGWEEVHYGDRVKADEREGFILGMTLGKLAGKGGFGTPSNVGSNLEFLISRSSAESQEAKGRGVRAFLRSVNFARASREGLVFSTYQDDITSMGGMALADERYYIFSMGFEGNSEKGPLVPHDASEDEKKRVAEEYEKFRSASNQIARERAGAELEAARAKVPALEAEIASLEQRCGEAQRAEASLPQLLKQFGLEGFPYHGLTPLAAARRAIEELGQGIARVEKEIAGLNDEKVGFLDLGRKRERSQDIERKENELHSYSLKRDAIERALPVFEQAESSAKLGGSYNISTRILERKGELTRAQEDLRVAERAMEIVNKT